MNDEAGLLFNIQRFSIQDGPGIRTTIFMKGCPLECEWCSNPESQNVYKELINWDKNCIGCGRCIEACTENAIILNEGVKIIDRDKCNRCFNCTQVCPTGALKIAGFEIGLDEIMKEILRDEMFYRKSGGGITISGGEPLLQSEFIWELLKICRQKCLHTALDTSGHSGWQDIEKILDSVDLVLYDIKHIDSARHKEKTGVHNELILANLGRVAEKTRTWLRYPVIPGFNDFRLCAREIASYAKDIPVEKVSLLPYHAFGSGKYERLGREYVFANCMSPNEEKMQEIADVFVSYGFIVTIGY